MKNKITDSNTKYERFIKPVIQRLTFPKGPHAVAFIFGAQRSGTTLLTHLYNQLDYARVFGEYSSLNKPPEEGEKQNIRMQSIEDVEAKVQKMHAPLVVMKPLVESQHANRWLKINNSSAIWMYRHYLDVASSNIKKFKTTNGLGDIQPMLDRVADNWRSEGVSDNVHKTLSSLIDNNTTPHEAACLFWYARNSLFFELGINRTRTMLLSYKQLQRAPKSSMTQVLAHHGVLKNHGDFDPRVFDVIEASSYEKPPVTLEIRDEIRQLCDSLYHELSASPQNIQ